jgi:hypothetical protein
MDEATKRLWDVGLGVAQLALAIVGGLWVFFRFRRERTHVPRITFHLDCKLHGPVRDSYLAEFVVQIKNDGAVIHRFTEISLRVRGIPRDVELQEWKEAPPRLEFPVLLVRDADVHYKRKYDHIFVEPGIAQDIIFVTQLPNDMAFLLARAEFKYDDRRWHSTKRVIVVPGRGVA